MTESFSRSGFHTVFQTALRLSCLAMLPLALWGDSRALAASVPAAFRTDSSMVLVPVTVTDRNGKTVQGLRAEDFDVREDQVPQRILSFSADDAPCSVGLVLDISGSMRYTLDSAKEIARSFFETANPEDEFMLLTVSSHADASSGFTTNIADLEESIDRAGAGGMTALIDTVHLGLNRMRKARQPRRALLIISDGMDNYSRYSKSELMRDALEADVQVYTIVIPSGPGGTPGGAPFRPSMIAKPGDQGREREGPRMLEELAEKTGGLHFLAGTGAEAKEAAVKVGRALREEYVIGYRPPTYSVGGKWHRVHVKATGRKVNVYARNGYYAP